MIVRLPFRSTVCNHALATVLMALVLAASPIHAQSTRRPVRETNANRKARIAQEVTETYTHRWEVGGGGGFLRFRSGQYTQQNNEISFWMNTTYYLNEKLGLTAEIRGYYGNAKIQNYNPYANFVGAPQISEYPFLIGPTYRLRLRQKTAVSAFVLGGTAIGKFDGDSKGLPATTLGLWPSTNAAPTLSVGGNLDYNLYPNFAFRIAPSYLFTKFGNIGILQHNLGFEMGLVYRFGRQK